MENKEKNKRETPVQSDGNAISQPPKDRMMRSPVKHRAARSADILPRDFRVPGSRPILVESDDQ